MFEELTNEEVLIIDGGGTAYDVSHILGIAVAKGWKIADFVLNFGTTEIINFVMCHPELWFLL